MRVARGHLLPLACLALALVAIAPSPASAVFDTRLIVAVSGSPEPAPSGGQVAYTVTVRVDGSTKAQGVVVTVPLPPGTTFVKCTMLKLDGNPSAPCAPGLAGDVVSVNLNAIPAWKQPRITLTLGMPNVTSTTQLKVSADANGDNVTDDRNSATTTVLPPGSFITYLPSGRIAPIACGNTLGPGDFAGDTTAQLSGPLGCTPENTVCSPGHSVCPWGLQITAPGTTLDLNKFKIFWDQTRLLACNVGIMVSDAIKVTIIGGSTGGTSGIEFFDWCVKDSGQAKKLSINSLRCFRARSAAINIAAKKSQVSSVKIDRAAGGKPTDTAALAVPGGIAGVGIKTRGDRIHIQNSLVLRTTTYGIWVAGSDVDGTSSGVLIDGGTRAMHIQPAAGVGLLLQSGPHT